MSVTIERFNVEAAMHSRLFCHFRLGDRVLIGPSTGSDPLCVVYSSKADMSGRRPKAITEQLLARYMQLETPASASEGLYSMAYDVVVHQNSTVVATVSLGSDDTITHIHKAKCAVCNCFVRVAGHSARCATRTEEAMERAAEYRRRAWLGDALHALDVRTALLLKGVELVALEPTAQSFSTGEHMERAYNQLLSVGVVPEFTPLGPSRKQVATAFEASYKGDYRVEYISRILGISASNVDGMIRVLYCP